MLRLRIGIVATVLSMGVTLPVLGNTLNVVGDSQTNSAQPNQKAGTSALLQVRNVPPGGTFQTFVRFDLSVLPANPQIVKATLRLWVASVANSGIVEVRPVLGPWDEGTLDYSTAPPLGSPASTFPVATSAADGYVLADITLLVQDWLSGNLEENGIALVGSTADAVTVKFDSKENTATSHPAEIEVVLAATGPEGPPGPPGAQGPPGPAGPPGPPADLTAVQAQLDALAARVAALEAGSGGNGLRPVAPTASDFMWQGQQRRFTKSGAMCDGQVALGVGDQAVCYGAVDGTLRCAGSISNVVSTPIFTQVPGRTDVDQVFVSPNAGAICVHQADGTAWCAGNYNGWGQFGNGSTGPTSSFTQWGASSSLVALASGTWDQFCAIDTSGQVSCAGNGFTPTPTPQGGPGHAKMWVAPWGVPIIDDASVFRAGESRTECQVTASGFTCAALLSPLGTPGALVSGGQITGLPDEPFPPLPPPPPGPDPSCSQLFMNSACYMTSAGTVSCVRCSDTGLQTRNYFAPGSVVALGSNFYGNNLCAVYADGSLWCMGNNTSGMFGTGDVSPRNVPTQVQPAGSVKIGCP